MLHRLLPALLPGWRFFDQIGPSPRLDYACLPPGAPLVTANWLPFCPPPARPGVSRLLLGLLWNPDWNEHLYVTRCAERVLEGETGFPLAELRRRVDAAARAGRLYPPGTPEPAQLSYRIRAVLREDEQIVERVVFVDTPWVPGTVPPA